MASSSQRTPVQQPGNRFGMLLRSWRLRAGLTQERLAERAGLGVRTVRYLERGQVRPQSETVRLLADALQLDADDRAELAALTRPVDALAAVGSGPPTPVPAQLPADVAGFTGRAGDLAELDGLLADRGPDATRAMVVSAIVGTAGVGKTALAVHWTHRVRDRFPGRPTLCRPAWLRPRAADAPHRGAGRVPVSPRRTR
jgi:transcriptional regulator with XRE-family HTH domain